MLLCALLCSTETSSACTRNAPKGCVLLFYEIEEECWSRTTLPCKQDRKVYPMLKWSGPLNSDLRCVNGVDSAVRFFDSGKKCGPTTLGITDDMCLWGQVKQFFWCTWHTLLTSRGNQQLATNPAKLSILLHQPTVGRSWHSCQLVITGC